MAQALRGSITEDDQSFVETWENISATSNVIIRLDVRGDEKPEVVTGRRTFLVTTQERLITESRVLDKVNDPFANGCFRPVVVPMTVDVKSNPNALSDEEIQRVFTCSALAWEEWMKVIDAPETLRRMLDLAEDSEITMPRFRELERRLHELKPQTRITQKDQEQYDRMSGAGAPANTADRRRGGRSADYRTS